MISFLVEQKKCKWITWNNWEEQNEKKLSPAHDVNQDYLTVMKKDEVEERNNRRNHMGKKNFFHLLGIEFFSNPQTLYKIRP